MPLCPSADLECMAIDANIFTVYIIYISIAAANRVVQ